MANAGRPRSTNIKTEEIQSKDFARLDLDLEPGIKNTLFVNENNKIYIGDTLSVGIPYDDAIDDLKITGLTIDRNSGSFLFELDSNKSVCIIKDGGNINLYEVNSGSAMTFITVLTTLNTEVYLEALFGLTEKGNITGYSKYVFLSLPGEAWVVAYNTRIGTWQVEKVNNTYSIWTVGTALVKGNRRIPTVANGYYYEVTVAGTTGGVQPTWPTTLGDTVTDGTVTWICRGRYNNYPVTTSSSARLLNGYIFVCVSGDIYNSDLDLPDSWNTTDFISTEIYPDPVVALAKYKNYLVAFGQNTVEFFYDAANTSGSPLARQEGILHNIGCVGQSMVSDSEDKIYWISQTSSGTYSIWTLEKFEAKKVSSPEIDVILSKRLNQVVNLYPEYLNYYYMFVTRVNGSLMLCIPLFYRDISSFYISSVLVVDFEKEAFYEWELTPVGISYIGKPVSYKSYYLYGGTTGTDFLFCILGIPRYEPTLGGLPEDLIVQTSSFETIPLDFDSNNYKSLYEINFNVYPEYSSTAYIGVSLDRGSFTSLPPIIGAHRISRLGRAREFRIKFQDTKILARIQCKYSEHSN